MSVQRIPVRVMKMPSVPIAKALTAVLVNKDSLEMEQSVTVSEGLAFSDTQLQGECCKSCEKQN